MGTLKQRFKLLWKCTEMKRPCRTDVRQSAERDRSEDDGAQFLGRARRSRDHPAKRRFRHIVGLIVFKGSHLQSHNLTWSNPPRHAYTFCLQSFLSWKCYAALCWSGTWYFIWVSKSQACVCLRIGRQFAKVSGKVEEAAKSSSASTESCSESWESWLARLSRCSLNCAAQSSTTNPKP